MASIYTQQLFNADALGTFDGVVYTVPAGKFAIVTNIDAFLDNGASNQESVAYIGSAGVCLHVSAGSEVITQQWSGRQAINAGQTVEWHFNGIFWRLGITGYVLDVL